LATAGFVRWSLFISAVIIETQNFTSTHMPGESSGVMQSGIIVVVPMMWEKI
jgi:hypothetical protein